MERATHFSNEHRGSSSFLSMARAARMAAVPPAHLLILAMATVLLRWVTVPLPMQWRIYGLRRRNGHYWLWRRRNHVVIMVRVIQQLSFWLGGGTVGGDHSVLVERGLLGLVQERGFLTLRGSALRLCGGCRLRGGGLQRRGGGDRQRGRCCRSRRHCAGGNAATDRRQSLGSHHGLANVPFRPN